MEKVKVVIEVDGKKEEITAPRYGTNAHSIESLIPAISKRVESTLQEMVKVPQYDI